jgi:hypothetical protein
VLAEALVALDEQDGLPGHCGAELRYGLLPKLIRFRHWSEMAFPAKLTV